MTGQARWGDDEETMRLRPPVDPWADRGGDTAEIPVRQPRRRAVYGRVYEVFTTRPDIDGPHPYAGQTTTTIHQRVHGPNGHTSPGEVAKAPWKARIKPGRAGYRQLKVIYASGDPAADQVRLDMAEAFAIDELRTTYNTQRPIRSPGTPRPVRPRPASRPLPARAVAAQRRRVRVRFRMAALLALVLFFTYLSARVAVAMRMDSPAFPWVAAPIAGVAMGWSVFWYLHRAFRKLTR